MAIDLVPFAHWYVDCLYLCIHKIHFTDQFPITCLLSKNNCHTFYTSLLVVTNLFPQAMISYNCHSTTHLSQLTCVGKCALLYSGCYQMSQLVYMQTRSTFNKWKEYWKIRYLHINLLLKFITGQFILLV